MNDGKVKVYRVQCLRCKTPGLWVTTLCVAATLRSARRIAAAHTARTGHFMASHNIRGRYVTPADKGEVRRLLDDLAARFANEGAAEIVWPIYHKSDRGA